MKASHCHGGGGGVLIPDHSQTIVTAVVGGSGHCIETSGVGTMFDSQ